MLDESLRIDVGEHRGCFVSASASIALAGALAAESKPFTLLSGPRVPHDGDLLLVRVAARRGTRPGWLQNAYGRRIPLLPGDVFVGIAGARDSTEGPQGEVPPMALTRGAELHLLSEGGIVGRALWVPPNGGVVELELLGNVARGAKALRLAPDPGRRVEPTPLPPMLLVAGTATGIGKTTLATRLIHTLTQRLGQRVSAIMMSGTGGKGDTLMHRAAGAHHFHSFIEAGLTSSYGERPEIHVAQLEKMLVRMARDEMPDVIVGEMGGDFVWGANDVFLRKSWAMQHVAGMWLVTHDVVGAWGARQLLSRWGVSVPLVHVVSWTQSYGAMKRRFARMVGEEPVDPTDDGALEERLESLLSAARRPVVRRSCG